MTLTVTYNNPSYAEGEELALKGLGVLTNGSPVELTESQELDFLAEYGHTVREHVDGYKRPGDPGRNEPEVVEVSGDDNIKITGTALVPPKEAAKLTSVPVSTGPPSQPPVEEEGGED